MLLILTNVFKFKIIVYSNITLKCSLLQVKQIHIELKKKDTTIIEMKSKMKKIRATARKYKNKLNEGHKLLVQQYKEMLLEIQKRMEVDILEKEKEVNLKIEQMQQEYEAKEKHYRDKLIHKKIIS